MRRALTPCAVTTGKDYLPLNRVEFTDRRVAESFLQEALNRNPTLLPLEEIDPAFGPIASLGREIASTDNLFISPLGRLTLVETKLWRNPESGREVVGQLLDYASVLGAWSYEELEVQARSALQSPLARGESLHGYVSRLFPEEALPESRFIDAVNKTLRTGRFLMLIVGDGIREGVERMLEHLHEHPQRHFTLGLVELGIYENPAVFGGRILIPSLVAKTTEVVRAVVRVETSGPANVSVVTVQETQEATGGPRRRTLSEVEFLQELPDEATRLLYERLFALGDELGLVRTWRSSSVSLRLPDPNGSKYELTLVVLSASGEIYTGFLQKQLARLRLPRTIGVRYLRTICSVFDNLQPDRDRESRLSRTLTVAEVTTRYDKLADAIRETVDAIKAATPDAAAGEQ